MFSRRWRKTAADDAKRPPATLNLLPDTPLFLPGIDLSSIFWQSGMRSGPEYFRLGRRELFVCQRARGVQLCEVFDLVGRVRRRGRILRLVLAVAGRRLVVGLCCSSAFPRSW